LPKFLDIHSGASQIYETVLLKLVLVSDIIDKDIVCIFGDIETSEMELYLELIKRLIGDHRVSAIYSFGNFSDALQSLRKSDSTDSTDSDTESNPIPMFHLYHTSILSETLYAQTLQSNTKYSPTYNTYLWVGAFQWESEPKPLPISKVHSKAFVYSPIAWCSLHPESVFHTESRDSPIPTPTLTYEPLGILQFFTDSG
jgi:hypothetical protein